VPRVAPPVRLLRLNTGAAGSAATNEATTRRRAPWILLVAGFVLAFTLAALLLTLWNTALDANWYRNSAEDNNAYNRFYNRVLTDPAVARETRDLLAGLPIDHSLVAANIRLVLPPAALQASINRTLDTMVGYLRGERGTFDPVFALGPVFDHIRKLADQYLSDTITNLRPLQAKNVDDFATNALRFANDLGAGRRPTGLPTVAFSPDQVSQVAGVLLQPLSPPDRDRLQLPVNAALAAGDLGTAIATVAPAYGQDHTNRVIVNLTQDAHGTHLRVDGPLSGVDNATVVIDMSRIRFLTGTLLPLLLIGSVLAAGGCLVALGRLARRSGRHGPLLCATTVIATGLLLAVMYTVARLVMGNPFSELFGHSNLPPALHTLLSDIATSLFHGLDTTFTEVVMLAVVPATAVVLWVAVAPRLVIIGSTPSKRSVVITGGALATVVAVGMGWVFVANIASAAPRGCNGHTELCSRRYDQVVFAESHNAMSASDLGWIGANQDVPMPDQLAGGVRVLHIDTRYWETPQVTASFASTLPPDLQGVVLAAAAAANPVRPGVWLCHALCRLGATKLLTGLRQIAEFMRDNPNEVVTLDIEDKVSAADTVAVFRQSGLSRYVYTPGDPRQPWPTLGQMIDSGRRLVVFAENHGGTPNWYAKLYRYAMETPYTFTTPSAFSCRPNRGGTGKRLFVLNHFITRDAPSRNDAAVVNASAVVVSRARQCATKRGRLPNFVNVDFSTLGDLTRAVDTLNRVPHTNGASP
jgi:hypothetical protein